MPPASERHGRSGWGARKERALQAEGLVFLAALLWVVGRGVGAYGRYLDGDRPVAGLRLEGASADDDPGALERAGHGILEVRAVDHVEQVAASEAGAVVDVPATRERLRRVGRSGNLFVDLAVRAAASRGEVDVPAVLRVDAGRALAYFETLARRVDRPAQPGRLDLDGRRVVPPQPGRGLIPADGIAALSVALRSGRRTVDLALVSLPPEAPRDPRLARLDIGVVLGAFETRYSTAGADRDRAHNLEVGAVAVDGYVLDPGATFSFNGVVGPRTAENGYRYAPGITAGEMVDVLGGGICQVSSTLFGAAFFAGLDVVRARPHSRPSSYVHMGLDSTVVYPDVDLVLRNPYDFPVVFHMKVAGGSVRAEVLGAKRPYRVAFERRLLEELPYERRVRDDETLLQGTERVVQWGRRGYRLERRRVFYDRGRPVRTESWVLFYPPTLEIVRRGTNPAGAHPPGQTRPPMAPPSPTLRIVQ